MSKISKTCLGFSITVLCLATVVMFGVLTNLAVFESSAGGLSVSLVFAGLISWLLGRWQWQAQVRRDPDWKSKQKDYAEHHPLAFFGSFSYWGFMLFMLAGIAYGRSMLNHPPASISIEAPILPPLEQVVEASIETIEPPPVTLQGIVVRDGKSSAIIDGATYFEGERIGRFIVAAINSTMVRLDCENQSAYLYLGIASH